MTAKEKKKKHAPFVFTHTHTHTHTLCIFRCLPACARRPFYVVGDLRLWSRCLGSDNIMTESTGVTATGTEHTRAQTDTRADTVLRVILDGAALCSATEKAVTSYGAGGGDYSHDWIQCAYSCELIRISYSKPAKAWTCSTMYCPLTVSLYTNMHLFGTNNANIIN